MASAHQRKWAGQVLIALVCLVLASQVGRLAYLNAVQGAELRAKARAQQLSRVTIPGRRGPIMDRQGRMLAASRDLPTLFADPLLIDDPTGVAAKVAGILGEPVERIEALITRRPDSQYVAIQRGISQELAERILALDIKGIGTHNEPVRVYPMGTLAAQVIGFVGRGGEGLDGIEKQFHEHLTGASGYRIVIRDAKRRAMYQEPDSYVPPREGGGIMVTLDAVIQEITERAVRVQVEHHAAESGIGIVMDPRTGDVLAMANYPTFDPGAFGDAPPDARRNRILTDPVEPGSIFKPYTMVTALADGKAHPDEVIYCESGTFVIGSRRLHDHHSYGNLTVAQGMIKSSNILMAKLGLRLGNTRLHETMTAFGFGGRTGFDLWGEDPGLLMPLRAWTSYSTTSVPMGQELAVTPIQIATAFSAIVNGGRLLQPRAIRARLDEHGRVREEFVHPVERHRIVDAQAAATMSEILERVITEGTGKACTLDKWRVMGKTGTAQVPRRGRRGYEHGAYLASFIAAVPASDPQLVVLVMIRKPTKNGYYGAQVALPGARSILEQTLTYLNVPPDKPGAGVRG